MTVENRKQAPVPYNPARHGPIVQGTQTGDPSKGKAVGLAAVQGKADRREWVTFGRP